MFLVTFFGCPQQLNTIILSLVAILLKASNWTLQDLLLTQIIPGKLNFLLSLQYLSLITMWHSNKNFNNSLFNFTTLFMVYKLQTVLILKLPSGVSFTCAKTVRSLVDMDLLLRWNWQFGAIITAKYVISSQDVYIQFVKSVINLKNSWKCVNWTS